MKRPGQTNAGKAQSRLQRQQRRNYQKNPTKRTGVHPVAGNPTNPTPAPRPKPHERKGAYKLNDRTIGALISSINRSADAPIEMHCGCAGVSRDTYWEWRKLASEQPKSEYARQIAKVDKALFAAWRRLHEAAVKHRASEVLFRRHHDYYPSERQKLELTGLEGLPLIPTENAFAVVIELASPQPDDERQFTIEHRGGARDGEREIWQPPNGQEPPPP